MAGETNAFVRKRSRGRPVAVARNFLAAVGNVASSSSASNNNNSNNQQQQQYYDPQRHQATPATPKKSPSVHANITPATEISSSSPSPYSPQLWGSAPTRRSSSTRSQQSGKTEPTLDTLESSLGRESSSTSLRQPQPLQRTPNLRGQQGGASPHPIKKPTTIYEQPHVMAAPTRHEQQQQQHELHPHAPHNHGHYGQHQHHYAPSSSQRYMESPSTPDASHRIYSPPMFPATSPHHHHHSDHSTLTGSTSRATPNTNGATFDEIRPTESYLIPSPSSRTNDFEQRTTTSSITTHSTSQQQRVASLDAHVQQKTPQPAARQSPEDWESVSTNEVSGYGHRVNVQNMPGEHNQQQPTSLGQSIDQGIDLLLGSRWVQCAAPMVTLPDRAPLSTTPSPSQSPSRNNRRYIQAANSSVSGASTEIATNRAVDLALKRVQEIEKSRGTEQALHEARQALVRLKDTQYLRPSPPPPDFTVQMPSTPLGNTPTMSAASSPSMGRLSFGAPSIPAPKCEAKSILSDSTEEGSGSHTNNNGSVSNMQMLPVGRLDKKVHRMAQQQQGQYTEDGDHSLQNDSLPSSIGVEVDSKGVTKSNPALRAVFEQHTLESLRRQRGASYKQQQREADFVNPARESFYLHPPPPPNPPSTRRVTHNEVRNYSMKTGQRTIVHRAPSNPPPVVQQQTFREDPHAPDPIVCHGSYVSYDPDGNESSVVPTVVHPPHLMTAPSRDSTLSGDNVFDGLSSPAHGARKSSGAAPTPDRIISPLSTHISAVPVPVPPTQPKTRPASRFARASRLAKRWPPMSSSRALSGQNQPEQKHAEGNRMSNVTGDSGHGKSEPQRSEGEAASDVQATQHVETVTSNLHSSPAWASKQRMQEVQHQSTGQPSPKPVTPGIRISELRKQLFAKKPDRHGLDSFVVRRNSHETLGEPAIDDTSIDLQSVRSTFESVRESLAEAEEEDSDDDTASVKSLKEKFEGSTGSARKKESGVSKVRAMFESKNRPPSKPFEGGTSELQEVFSKFQRNVKPVPKPKLQRRVSQEKVESNAPLTEKTEADAPGQEDGACPETPDEKTPGQSKQGGTRGPTVGAVSVAERIKALKENSTSTPIRRKTIFSPYGTPKSSMPAPKLEKRGNNIVAPIGQVRPRGSPTTINEARQSLRSSPNKALSKAHLQRDESGGSSAIPGPVTPAKLRSSPASVQDAALHQTAPPHITHSNAAEFARPRSSPTTIGEARKFLRPAPALQTNEIQTQQDSGQTQYATPPYHAPETVSAPPATPKQGEKVVESSASPMPGARNVPVANYGEGLAGESHVSRNPENQAKLRSSPTTIEEARKALRASPLSHLRGAENSHFESDPVDESQIEQEIAAITATDRLNDSSDTSVRKFDWFQRAAVEAGGMSQGEDTSTDNRPVTPRVQDRVRMFASANAAISGVRRPVPTPANFNAELREIAKQRPMTPERQRLSFRGWMGEPVSDIGLSRPGGVNGEGNVRLSAVQTSPVDLDMQQPSDGFGGQPMEIDVEKWLRPKPRRFDPAATAPSPRGFVRDYGPQQHNVPVAPQMSGGDDYLIPMQPMGSHHIEDQYVQKRQVVAHDHSTGKGLNHSEDSRNVSAVAVQADMVKNSSSAKQGSVDQDVEESGSEFSDGVTLDMSIAEVSGLTLPTALISRAGGEKSVATVEEEVEQDSENSSKQNAEVEARRSEASSSQTSEALVPLLNKCLRQRPMSDERSMGDSFFEARAIVANHWSKTSEIGQQRIAAKEAKKTHDVKDDSSGGWDAARIENSFPVTPSNAGDMFEFESGWEAFSADKIASDDPFKADEEKKSDDPAARSTTPTRSNRARQSGSYLDRRYPEYPPRQSDTLHNTQPPTELTGQLREPTSIPHSGSEAGTLQLPATSSSFDASPEDSQVVALSSFESAERLSRSHLARHAVNRAGSVTVHKPHEASLQGPPEIHNTQRSQEVRPASFFGRTHPQTADPTWKKESYSPSYDPTLPTRPTQQQEAQVPSWRPPTNANPIGDAMQRYGAQHAALLARLKALKEARVRRANAIYARTTSMFPRQVEIDDYSLSTKSSTQFGGSHFMESLKVD